MKNLVNVLIGLAAIVIIISMISRITVSPILGIESRAMGDLAGILLLLAIALSVKK